MSACFRVQDGRGHHCARVALMGGFSPRSRSSPRQRTNGLYSDGPFPLPESHTGERRPLRREASQPALLRSGGARGMTVVAAPMAVFFISVCRLVGQERWPRFGSLFGEDSLSPGRAIHDRHFLGLPHFGVLRSTAQSNDHPASSPPGSEAKAGTLGARTVADGTGHIPALLAFAIAGMDGVPRSWSRLLPGGVGNRRRCRPNVVQAGG